MRMRWPIPGLKATAFPQTGRSASAKATEKPTENIVHDKFYFSNTECCQFLHYMSPHLYIQLKEHCFQLHLPRDTKVPVHFSFVFWHNKNSAAKLSHTHTQAV